MGKSLYPLPGIDLRDYGAKADDATSAAVAIQNALAQMPVSGGVLDIPPGKYYVPATIELPHALEDGARLARVPPQLEPDPSARVPTDPGLCLPGAVAGRWRDRPSLGRRRSPLPG